MKRLLRTMVLILSALLGLALAWAMLQLPEPVVHLPTHVTAQLDNSGVSHPVTAVLLNFRGYDTLLEIAVLLLALLGVLAAVHGAHITAPSSPRGGQLFSFSYAYSSFYANTLLPGQPLQPLQPLARMLAPLIVLVAGYLLWAGAHQPGGAFQAGAVLAAGAVLLNLASIMPSWTAPGPLLRTGLVSGFLIFLTVAAGLLAYGRMLQYPPAWAGALILLIESGLTISLGLILAGLFLALPHSGAEPEQ